MACLELTVSGAHAGDIRQLLRKRWAEGVRWKESGHWVLWRRFEVTGLPDGVQLVADDYARWEANRQREEAW